jgi:hypothetical protein
VTSGSVPDAAAAPTPVAEPSAKDVFKMLILEGDVRREVDFEDGVPVSDTGAPNTSAGNQPDSNPPPVVDEPKEPTGGSSTDKTGP